MKLISSFALLFLVVPVSAQTASDLPATKPVVEEKTDLVKPAVEVEETSETAAEEPAAEEITLHTIKAGGSLTAVSEEAYGRTRYWRILKLYNKVDPSKLQVGQEIKAPNIPWLIKNSGLEARYPKAVAHILGAKSTLTAIQDQKTPPTAEDFQKIKEAAGLIAEAQTLLMKETEGVSGKPSATVTQLRTVHSHLLHIANKTKKGRTDPNSLAHEHLSNAIVYGVLWAQGGFK